MKGFHRNRKCQVNILACYGQAKVREIPVLLRVFCCKSGNFLCAVARMAVSMHIFHDLVKYICTRSIYPHLIIIRQTIFFKTWFVFIFCIMFGTRCRQFSWCWKRSLVLTFLESLTTISLNAANYRKNYNIRHTFVGNKIAVFDFNSSPIVNTMKNSCGLWDLKIL